MKGAVVFFPLHGTIRQSRASGINKTFKMFYRLNVCNDFAGPEDTQLFLNPALIPDEDKLWDFDLPTRLAL